MSSTLWPYASLFKMLLCIYACVCIFAFICVRVCVVFVCVCVCIWTWAQAASAGEDNESALEANSNQEPGGTSLSLRPACHPLVISIKTNKQTHRWERNSYYQQSEKDVWMPHSWRNISLHSFKTSNALVQSRRLEDYFAKFWSCQETKRLNLRILSEQNFSYFPFPFVLIVTRPRNDLPASWDGYRLKTLVVDDDSSLLLNTILHVTIEKKCRTFLTPISGSQDYEEWIGRWGIQRWLARS